MALKSMNINDVNIDQRNIADRAVDAIADGFYSYGYVTDASTDERIWEAVLEALELAQLTRLS